MKRFYVKFTTGYDLSFVERSRTAALKYVAENYNISEVSGIYTYVKRGAVVSLEKVKLY